MHDDMNELESPTNPPAPRSDVGTTPPRRPIRPVEAVVIAVVAIFVIAALFDVDIAVARRPAFDRLFGRSTVSPPSAASPATTAPSAGPSDGELAAVVLPASGSVLPVAWGDVGK